MTEDKNKQDKYLEAREFLNQKSVIDIAEVMQEYAELYHAKKEREFPKSIMTREELSDRYHHGLTVGRLKEILYKTTLPADAKVLIQRIEDRYYNGNDISGFRGCSYTEDGIYPPGSKSEGWGVFLKEGESYHNAMSMNKKMREEIARRERGEEPEYPQMEDPSQFITPEDDETLNELKEQYHPAWCVVGYKDEEHLFINLHY